MPDTADATEAAAITAAADALSDQLTMLGIDPQERPEHGGESTAECLARTAIEHASKVFADADDAAINEMVAGTEFLGMNPNSEGGIDLRVKMAAKLAAGLVQAAKGVLEAHPDARNYLEQSVIDRETGDRYVITFCRPGGRTPHQLREDAERQLATANNHIASLKNRLAIAVAETP